MLLHELVYAAAIAFGLPVAAHLDETPVNIACVALFVFLYTVAPRWKTRVEMIVVLALAFSLELYFAEACGLHTYQRGYMPLYVPTAHWFVFDLGRRVAERLGGWGRPGDGDGEAAPGADKGDDTNRRRALLLLAPFVPAALAMAWGGVLALALNVVVLLWLVFAFVCIGPAPIFFSVMCYVALLVELNGTHQSVWAWAVYACPALYTPLLVGTFYGFTNFLLSAAVDAALVYAFVWERRKQQRAPSKMIQLPGTAL